MITIYRKQNVISYEGRLNELEIRGLSTDKKPTSIDNKNISNGSIFFEIDTGDVYMYDLEHNRWKKISSNSGVIQYAPRYINFNSYAGTDLDYETANLDVSNLEIMDFMFSGCNNLVNLDLSMWRTSHITSMQTMFSNCRALKTLDLSNFTLDSVTKPSGIYHMFNNCTSLEKLDIRNMVLSDISSEIMTFISGVPTTCEIIVKDNTELSWWNTTYPDYTNVKIAE